MGKLGRAWVLGSWWGGLVGVMMNEHRLIIRSCNLKHKQYVNMIARKNFFKKMVIVNRIEGSGQNIIPFNL